MKVPAEINIAKADLPGVYQSAKAALANCAKIDECQRWANKAEALASYARQADDDTLRKMADRIQARAVRRCGELLKQYNSQGRRTDQLSEGIHDKSQREAADDAGVSPYQELTAVRVANVSSSDFEDALEGDDPATVTKLAEMGKKTGRAGFKEATHLIGAVRRFAEFCGENEAALVAGGVLPHEVEALKINVSEIDSWLDQFVIKLEDVS